MTWAGMSRSQPRRRLSRAIGPAERVRAARGLSGYLVPVIIWINGAFGAGKTTLAGELHRRLPDAVVYNPEDVGLMLWKWIPPGGDFQHLPSWRELVVAAAVSLRRHHARDAHAPLGQAQPSRATRQGAGQGRPR